MMLNRGRAIRFARLASERLPLMAIATYCAAARTWSLLGAKRMWASSHRAARFMGTRPNKMQRHRNFRKMPIRANIVGPPSATRSSASMAACHPGALCSFFGSAAM